jgi:hypothetical protein
MYHAGPICRIGCAEPDARFDGQFGLPRNYEWKCLGKCERKFVGMRRAWKPGYWLSWNSSCQAI